ncbi:MAG: hypothetical protein JXA09_08255 [Anaerolineae bacterium]|nr:hypothetical protein [Anaerolineae bacterium]
MRTIYKTEGGSVAFVMAELEPAYHDAALGLYYRPSAEGYAKRFPADTPHLERIYQRFARYAEEMVLQTARVHPAPWDRALAAFVEMIEGEHIAWRLTGSVALALRGIDVRPRDVDLVVGNASAEKLGELLLDSLIEPVLPTPGWVGNWFGRAFLHTRVEWLGVDDPYAMAGLEVVHWRGRRITVPPLQMHLDEDRQRGLTERVEKIERYLMDQRTDR